MQNSTLILLQSSLLPFLSPYCQIIFSDIGGQAIWMKLWVFFWIALGLFFIVRVVRNWKRLDIINQKEWLEQKVRERTEELIKRKGEIKRKNELLEQKQEEIERQNEELHELNNTLEERVAQRTAQLQKALDKVLHSTRELDNFIYKAPHDFRGPIARLLGLVNLAKMDELSESSRGYLDKIEFTAMHMDVMLGKLMKVYDLGRAKLIPTHINLSELVQEVFEEVKQQLFIEGCELQVEDEFEHLFCSDLECLRVILANLLDNALLYSKSPQKVTVCLRLWERSGVEVQVLDGGMGILAESAPYIFEPFYKGSEASKGNGLGLFLVQSAVEKLDGNLDFQSEPNKYTVFNVRLPQLEA